MKLCWALAWRSWVRCCSPPAYALSLQQKSGLKPLTTNAWGHVVWRLDAGGDLSGQRYAVRFRVEQPLYRQPAVPGDSWFGDWLYRLPDLVGRMGPERAAYCTVLFPVVALNISVFAEGYQWTASVVRFWCW